MAVADIQDSQIEKAKKRIPYGNLKVYKDYNEMLASDIDAVIIATPVFKHAEHFEAAVKAGKHIYIEKPAAGTIADCKRIMRAGGLGGLEDQYYLRLPAPLRARLSPGEDAARFRRGG